MMSASPSLVSQTGLSTIGSSPGSSVSSTCGSSVCSGSTVFSGSSASASSTSGASSSESDTSGVDDGSAITSVILTLPLNLIVDESSSFADALDGDTIGITIIAKTNTTTAIPNARCTDRDRDRTLNIGC